MTVPETVSLATEVVPVKEGDAVKATTVPVPEVVYDCPHEEPEE